METTAVAQYYVLGRHASFDRRLVGADNDMILSVEGTDNPLLFTSQESAEAYFSGHSHGRSMSELDAFVRPAMSDEAERGEVQPD